MIVQKLENPINLEILNTFQLLVMKIIFYKIVILCIIPKIYKKIRYNLKNYKKRKLIFLPLDGAFFSNSLFII